MNAGEALKAAHAAGVQIEINGNTLVLKAAVPPPAAVHAALSQHKTEIIALLRSKRDRWQDYFDKQVRIAELTGGLSRAEAEAQAFECCVVEWLNRNPMQSPPGRCLECGKQERAYDPVAPYGTNPPDHAWLHPRCWGAWYAKRKATAAAAPALCRLLPTSVWQAD